jgi:bis(5'-nucleosidyl)-tetraphosphatase
MDSKHIRTIPLAGGTQKVVSAGIIVFRKTTEGIKFLVLYHGGDYWNFPKGKLEAEERSWQAAFREVREETGLKQNELKLITDFKEYEKFYFKRGNEKIFKVVILYLAETKQAQITLSNEHEGYGWFTFAQAKKMLARHKDNLRILNQAYSYLTRSRPVGQPTPAVAQPQRRTMHPRR